MRSMDGQQVETPNCKEEDQRHFREKNQREKERNCNNKNKEMKKENA